MNLKEQTVYIPITFDESFNGGRVIVATSEVTPREEMRIVGGDMYLKQHQNQILLSKDELVELVGKVIDDYSDSLLSAISNCFLDTINQSKADKDSDKQVFQAVGETITNFPIPSKEQFINNLFNNQ